MSSSSLVAWGVTLMICNGLVNTILATSGELLRRAGLPYFKMMCVADIGLCTCLIMGAVIAKVVMPDVRQAIWLFLRGLFGSSSIILLIVAVRVGASPGDAAALGSINTVIAALFGRLFLGEDLQWVHSVALSCAVVGAVLIAKPSFLFGGTEVSSSVLLGYGLALASGFLKASVFIAARKCMMLSPWLLNISPAICCLCAFTVLPLTPLVVEPEWGTLSSLVTIPICVALLLIHGCGMASQSAASKCCPAAVGATANTGSCMFSGYLFQMIFFNQIPDAISICGAALMFVSVVIMAFARVPAKPIEELKLDKVSPALEASSMADELEPAAEDDETESLASFIAAEFATQAAHTPTAAEKSVRQRRPGAWARQEPPQTLGAMTSVVAAQA